MLSRNKIPFPLRVFVCVHIEDIIKTVWRKGSRFHPSIIIMKELQFRYLEIKNMLSFLAILILSKSKMALIITYIFSIIGMTFDNSPERTHC